MSELSPRQQQRLKEKFNRSFPVGTRVVVRTDTHDLETNVSAPAEVLGGTAVAWFTGIRGCHRIDEGRVARKESP